MNTSFERLKTVAAVTSLLSVFAFVMLLGIADWMFAPPPMKESPHPELRAEARQLLSEIDEGYDTIFRTAFKSGAFEPNYSRLELDEFRRARASLRAALESSEARFDPFEEEKAQIRDAR